MSLPPAKLILAIALCLILVACSDAPDKPQGTSSPSLTAGGIAEVVTTPSATPGLSLTPRPGVLVDIDTARSYEAQGDIEAAAEAYIAIAASKSPDRIEATLSAARLLIDLDHADEARTLLEPLVAAQAGTPDGLSGAYLLGRAYAGLKMWQKAIDQYDAYIAGKGPAIAYAYLDRSYALVAMERGYEAADSAQLGLNLGVLVSMKDTFLLASAQSYERAGAFTQAIGYYNLLIEEDASASDVALGLARIASLKQVLKDPSYTVERDRLLKEYPSSQEALGALQDAEKAGEDIAPNVAGLVLYRHNEYTQAEPYFQKQIDNAPDAPETATAYYYRGAIVESRGKLDDALSDYAKVGTLDPKSSLADDALWWSARILVNQGKLDEGAKLYSRIVNEYPDSSFAADAAFKGGMIAYRAGSYVEAASDWQSDLASVSDSAESQRLQLWQGKALLQAGQSDAAASVLRQLKTAHEDDYYGIRAVGLSEGLHKQPVATQETGLNLTPSWDWAAAEQWMSGKTSLPATSDVWQTDPHWQRAQELWRIGHGSYGDLEIEALLDQYSDNAAVLYSLSRALLAEGRISMSARAGQRLLRVLDVNPNEGLPKALMSLAYPAAFGPLVQRYADAEGISPLLLLAFVRQESFFNPRAQSGAGAFGLTQLLPDSAKVAAKELGMEPNVPNDQLLHADLSLRLGARFMADQLSRFNGDIFVALAAYNGGPTAAAGWAKDAGEDPDVFLETIEFSQTRLYVEIVSENYAIYRYIYGGEPEPNLPQ